MMRFPTRVNISSGCVKTVSPTDGRRVTYPWCRGIITILAYDCRCRGRRIYAVEVTENTFKHVYVHTKMQTPIVKGHFEIDVKNNSLYRISYRR